ncbi:ABC transporter ATP-binding protein [Priestia taiwanensis]|uniref:Iron-dicitrate ABC transporter ATP-binding protein n=1 Tax=Priestia taiwanensis TaxID=1347902 RepID=A0A917EUB9_9BACI|nr:ABC transporter ATP-binding protein [Priestia taiwanensis]MBM7365280.1 iron complex transport system ATP-binding protein [Priestia taiwanensis]GGE85881.1 iron-dicitrate ABC transporter ATP-binding protein [Priestia taiwanensis]
MPSLTAEKVSIGYSGDLIIDDLSVHIPEGKITTIIGPNGCGKSTFLKSISRILKPKNGTIFLDGKAIEKQATKEIAKKMAILPQSAEAPPGLTVFELVSYGRFPHQRGFGKLTKEDLDYINWALEVTGLTAFSKRPVEALSGGQRQRVWIAMALAQGTDLLVLDEPTTYLDMAHQLEILNLLQKLNEEEKRTIVMVIHDLNHAARFSHNMIALRDGKLVKQGTPNEVMTVQTLRDVFEIEAQIMPCPVNCKPICLTYNLMSDACHSQHDECGDCILAK